MWSLFEIVAKPKLRYDLVLKRFLGRLLREIYRAGEPTDFNNLYYNAKIKLSRSTIREIELFMNDEDNCRPEALDDALSGILVELKPHNFFTSFEYTFGVDIVPMLTIGFFLIFFVLIALIKPQLRVSWLKCFITTFAISFFASIPWNWLYLYKGAYAKHQSKLMKVEILHKECMKLQNLSWFGSIREWFRSTLTFQSDPCEEYLKILLIDPFLEVPPIKAFVYTLTTFIIEPLRALGEGMGGFFQALVKDLPFILWIPVLIIITILSLGALMVGLPAVFPQQVRRFLPWLDRNQGTQALNQLQNDNVRIEQIVIYQSQPNSTEEETNIQILRSADRPQTEGVPDPEGCQGSTDERNNISINSSFEDQQEMWEEVRWNTVTPTDQAKGSQPELDYSQVKNKKVKPEKKSSHDEPCGDDAAPAPLAYRRKGVSISQIHTENVSAQKI